MLTSDGHWYAIVKLGHGCIDAGLPTRRRWWLVTDVELSWCHHSSSGVVPIDPVS